MAFYTAPSIPATLSSPHVEGVSHNLAIIHWIVVRPAYTPETYYVEYRRHTDSGTSQIFVSPSINGTSDLTITNTEYDIVLKDLDSDTNYVANIVSTNGFGERTSEDLVFRTNPSGI